MANLLDALQAIQNNISSIAKKSSTVNQTAAASSAQAALLYNQLQKSAYKGDKAVISQAITATQHSASTGEVIDAESAKIKADEKKKKITEQLAQQKSAIQSGILLGKLKEVQASGKTISQLVAEKQAAISAATKKASALTPTEKAIRSNQQTTIPQAAQQRANALAEAAKNVNIRKGELLPKGIASKAALLSKDGDYRSYGNAIVTQHGKTYEGTLYKTAGGSWMLVDVYGNIPMGGGSGSFPSIKPIYVNAPLQYSKTPREMILARERAAESLSQKLEKDPTLGAYTPFATPQTAYYNQAKAALNIKEGMLAPRAGTEGFMMGIGTPHAQLGYWPKEGQYSAINNVIASMKGTTVKGTLYRSNSGAWFIVDEYGEVPMSGSAGSKLPDQLQVTNEKLYTKVPPREAILSQLYKPEVPEYGVSGVLKTQKIGDTLGHKTVAESATFIGKSSVPKYAPISGSVTERFAFDEYGQVISNVNGKSYATYSAAGVPSNSKMGNGEYQYVGEYQYSDGRVVSRYINYRVGSYVDFGMMGMATGQRVGIVSGGSPNAIQNINKPIVQVPGTAYKERVEPKISEQTPTAEDAEQMFAKPYRAAIATPVNRDLKDVYGASATKQAMGIQGSAPLSERGYETKILGKFEKTTPALTLQQQQTVLEEAGIPPSSGLDIITRPVSEFLFPGRETNIFPWGQEGQKLTTQLYSIEALYTKRDTTLAPKLEKAAQAIDTYDSEIINKGLYVKGTGSDKEQEIARNNLTSVSSDLSRITNERDSFVNQLTREGKLKNGELTQYISDFEIAKLNAYNRKINPLLDQYDSNISIIDHWTDKATQRDINRRAEYLNKYTTAVNEYKQINRDISTAESQGESTRQQISDQSFTGWTIPYAASYLGGQERAMTGLSDTVEKGVGGVPGGAEVGGASVGIVSMAPYWSSSVFAALQLLPGVTIVEPALRQPTLTAYYGRQGLKNLFSGLWEQGSIIATGKKSSGEQASQFERSKEVGSVLGMLKGEDFKQALELGSPLKPIKGEFKVKSETTQSSIIEQPRFGRVGVAAGTALETLFKSEDLPVTGQYLTKEKLPITGRIVKGVSEKLKERVETPEVVTHRALVYESPSRSVMKMLGIIPEGAIPEGTVKPIVGVTTAPKGSTWLSPKTRVYVEKNVPEGKEAHRMRGKEGKYQPEGIKKVKVSVGKPSDVYGYMERSGYVPEGEASYLTIPRIFELFKSEEGVKGAYDIYGTQIKKLEDIYRETKEPEAAKNPEDVFSLVAPEEVPASESGYIVYPDTIPSTARSDYSGTKIPANSKLSKVYHHTNYKTNEGYWLTEAEHNRWHQMNEGKIPIDHEFYDRYVITEEKKPMQRRKLSKNEKQEFGQRILNTLKTVRDFELGGSLNEYIQAARGRIPKDIDGYTNNHRALAMELAKIYNYYYGTDNVRVSLRDNGSSISVIKEAGKKPENVVDLHNLGFGGQEGSIGRYGIRVEKPIVINGLRLMPLREQRLRKLTATMALQQTPEGKWYVGAMGEPRYKDIGDVLGGSTSMEILATPERKAELAKERGVLEQMIGEEYPIKESGKKTARERYEQFENLPTEQDFRRIPLTRRYIDVSAVSGSTAAGIDATLKSLYTSAVGMKGIAAPGATVITSPEGVSTYRTNIAREVTGDISSRQPSDNLKKVGLVSAGAIGAAVAAPYAVSAFNQLFGTSQRKENQNELPPLTLGGIVGLTLFGEEKSISSKLKDRFPIKTEKKPISDETVVKTRYINLPGKRKISLGGTVETTEQVFELKPGESLPEDIIELSPELERRLTTTTERVPFKSGDLVEEILSEKGLPLKLANPLEFEHGLTPTKGEQILTEPTIKKTATPTQYKILVEGLTASKELEKSKLLTQKKTYDFKPAQITKYAFNEIIRLINEPKYKGKVIIGGSSPLKTFLVDKSFRIIRYSDLDMFADKAILKDLYEDMKKIIDKDQQGLKKQRINSDYSSEENVAVFFEGSIESGAKKGNKIIEIHSFEEFPEIGKKSNRASIKTSNGSTIDIASPEYGLRTKFAGSLMGIEASDGKLMLVVKRIKDIPDIISIARNISAGLYAKTLSWDVGGIRRNQLFEQAKRYEGIANAYEKFLVSSDIVKSVRETAQFEYNKKVSEGERASYRAILKDKLNQINIARKLLITLKNPLEGGSRTVASPKYDLTPLAKVGAIGAGAIGAAVAAPYAVSAFNELFREEEDTTKKLVTAALPGVVGMTLFERIRGKPETISMDEYRRRLAEKGSAGTPTQKPTITKPGTGTLIGEHVYGNVESDLSPSRTGGFQELGSSKAVSEYRDVLDSISGYTGSKALGTTVYPFQVERSGLKIVSEDPVTNTITYRYNDKYIVSKATPTAELDKFGRKGNFVVHNYVFDGEPRQVSELRFVDNTNDAVALGKKIATAAALGVGAAVVAPQAISTFRQWIGSPVDEEQKEQLKMPKISPLQTAIGVSAVGGFIKYSEKELPTTEELLGIKKVKSETIPSISEKSALEKFYETPEEYMNPLKYEKGSAMIAAPITGYPQTITQKIGYIKPVSTYQQVFGDEKQGIIKEPKKVKELYGEYPKTKQKEPAYPKVKTSKYPETYPSAYKSLIGYTKGYPKIEDYSKYSAYQDYQKYAKYPAYAPYSGVYSEYAKYQEYPEYPSYPSYPSYPAYPSYQGYPSYPEYKSYPAYPPAYTVLTGKAIATERKTEEKSPHKKRKRANEKPSHWEYSPGASPEEMTSFIFGGGAVEEEPKPKVKPKKEKSVIDTVFGTKTKKR